MRRRNFIGLAGLMASAWPLVSGAQQDPKVARIGLLLTGSLENPVVRSNLDAIRQVFGQRGYREGKNITFEERGADGMFERLPAMAADLVRLRVDVIIAVATPAGRAAQRVTNTIPIVIGSMGDPVGDELVTSLARPGGNITGTTFLGPELLSKRLSMLKELIPAIARVAVLQHPGAFSERTATAMLTQLETVAGSLGVQLQVVDARSLDEFERAFVDMVKGRADALLQLPSPTFYENRKRIVDLAGLHRMPAMYQQKEFVELGGLIAYGANIIDLNSRTAVFADKILKGAKASDLPVEQPTKFECAINRKTAKTLGITIPKALLATADAIID